MDSGTAINHYWYASHYDQRVWHKPFNQPVTVAAGGQHVLTLWAREDRMDVDKVMLLPVGSAAPSGEGPVESARVPSTGALSPPNFLGGRPLKPTCRAVWCDFVSETFTDARGWTCHTVFSKIPGERQYICEKPKEQPKPVTSSGQEQYVFFHTDALGSPTAAFNEEGELCWAETYAPYGQKLDNEDRIAEPAQNCGLVGTDVGYTGHVQDGSGLVYAQQRYYDPVMPSAGALHMFGRYQYGNNIPYVFTDPTGMVGDNWADPEDEDETYACSACGSITGWNSDGAVTQEQSRAEGEDSGIDEVAIFGVSIFAQSGADFLNDPTLAGVVGAALNRVPLGRAIPDSTIVCRGGLCGADAFTNKRYRCNHEQQWITFRSINRNWGYCG